MLAVPDLGWLLALAGDVKTLMRLHRAEPLLFISWTMGALEVHSSSRAWEGNNECYKTPHTQKMSEISSICSNVNYGSREGLNGSVYELFPTTALVRPWEERIEFLEIEFSPWKYLSNFRFFLKIIIQITYNTESNHIISCIFLNIQIGL